uniref:Beta-2-glycoprotein 1 n=1 Tax=Mola mola TaxID=94237 RepID=A0A3Q3VWV8_MOLML
ALFYSTTSISCFSCHVRVRVFYYEALRRSTQVLTLGFHVNSNLNKLVIIRYVIQGASETRCLHDGTWRAPPPLCKAVNCLLPKPPRDGRIVHDKTVTGTTVMYGHSWTYERDPPMVPSYERDSCMADGTATEPPECRGQLRAPNDLFFFLIMQAIPLVNSQNLLQKCSMDSVLSLPAPCAVGIKSSHNFYNGKKLWIADLKPNRVLHGEHVTFYCLKKADRCGYPVVSTCNDGTLPIPECFVCEFLSVSLLLTNDHDVSPCGTRIMCCL